MDERPLLIAVPRRFKLCAQLLFTVAQSSRFLIVLCADGTFFLFDQTRELSAQTGERITHADVLHTHT